MAMTHASNEFPRRVWLERLAHALPYILFAAAMLLLDSIGRGATQEEFFKSVQDSVNSTGLKGTGGITARGFAIFMGVVGLIVGLVLLNNRLKRRLAAGSAVKIRTINQPRKLTKDVAKAAGLSGDEMRQLKSLADQHGHASPLTLLLCPSLLIGAAQDQATKADKQVLARLARKVVGPQ